ncbi:hypothetical protein BEH76_05050 [Shewanella algae]|nr:hypothetical protein BEH76_05050 [Shewanella algae]
MLNRVTKDLVISLLLEIISPKVVVKQLPRQFILHMRKKMRKSMSDIFFQSLALCQKRFQFY